MSGTAQRSWRLDWSRLASRALIVLSGVVCGAEPPPAGRWARPQDTCCRWQEDGRSGFHRGTSDGVALAVDQQGLALVPAGENLLADPGFEAPPESCPQTRDPYSPNPNPTNGWEHNGLAAQSGAIRAGPAHAGNGAWELVDTMSPGEPALLQRVPFKPEYRGKPFVFRVWARTREGTNPESMIALKFRSTTHWRCDVSRPLTLTPEWQLCAVAATLPADADELGVAIGPSSYTGQGAMLVDDAFLGRLSYPRQGTFTSEPHALGGDAVRVWRVDSRTITPKGTRAGIEIRTGTSPTPDRTWSRWESVDLPADTTLATPPGRFLQYRVTLRTRDPNSTPVVRQVRFAYGAGLGFVAGRVTHERTGAPICNAAVSVNGQTTFTDARGRYLVGVAPGTTTVIVQALHYLPATVAGPAVTAARQAKLDLKLSPDPAWPMFRGDSQRQGYSALSGTLDRFGVAWACPLGTVPGGQVVPADVDGDGRCEFIVLRGGSVSAWRLNGDRLWQLDGWEIGSILGVYDLLGTGEKQIIGVSDGWQPYANGAFTVIAARDGRFLSRVDTWPDAGDIGHGDTKDYLHGSFSALMTGSSVVADLDRDGKLELLVHPNYHSTLMAFHFHDGPDKPVMMWKTSGRFRYDLYLYPLLAADVDGDGAPEIVYHDNDLIRIFDGRNGSEKSAADMGCPRGLFGTMACGDVDGDGTSEVVLLPRFRPDYTRNTVCLAGWDGKALVRRWSRDFPEDVRARPFPAPLTTPFADVDGDRRPEIMVQMGADVLVLNGADGSDKQRITKATLREAADLDHDGVVELVVEQANSTRIYNGNGGFGPKPISYPPDWGWQDFGDGELARLRGGPAGSTEVVSREGTIKARLPGAAYMTSPVAADLDGDGRIEVSVREPTGIIRVLNGTDGTPRADAFPQLVCDPGGEFSRGCGITIADLDADGRSELVFCRNGRLTVTNCDGSVRFESAIGGLRFPAVGEFDGDGVRDVACYAGSRWLAFSGQDGHVLWDVTAPEANEVATWDVDGDGRDELTGKHGPVFLLNGADGRTLWTAFRREQCALGLGTFADLNGDGELEVLASGEYSNTAWFAGDGSSLWWIGWSSGGNKEHYGAVADVNGDGAQDFAIASNHGVLYCVDGRDARQLWTFSIPEKVSLSHCAAADLDGDARPEFVFGTNRGQLLIVDGEDGGLARSWDFRYPVGAPTVADLNGDGLAEVLVVANGTLYCLAPGQAAFLSVTSPDIVCTPARPIAGQPTDVRVTVRNLGGSKARSVPIGLSDGETEVARARLGSIPAGGSAEATLRWQPAAGPHRLIVRVGTPPVMAERQLTVQGLPEARP